MTNGWLDMQWGDLATLKYGKPFRGHENGSGPYRVYGTNGQIGWHHEFLAHHPTVIVGRKGAYRGVHYSAEPCFVIDTAFYLEPRTQFEMRWAYYELLTHDINSMDSGSAIPSTSREAFYRLPVRVPPLKEQKAIACILGTLDDKIELNRHMNQTMEAIARAIFKAWFVDFEPVRAKMEDRWRRGESLPGLPAHLYDLFPDRIMHSELGEIPEGWEVVRLPEAIEVNPTRTLRKEEVAPYLDMANMPTRGHTPAAVIDRPFGTGTRFINGDTLVARITPCLENGKTTFVDFLADGQVGWGSTEYIVLRPKPPLPEEFAYCLARSERFREFAIQSMTGSSGRQRVSPEALSRYLLTVPSEATALEFGSFVKPSFARASKAASESRTLAALRDSLLPKLISGEIRVKDAERFLEEQGA